MEANTVSACNKDYEIYRVFSGINLFVSVSNIVTNSILSFVLWKLKKLNTTSYRFIFVQSACDVLVGSAMLLSRIVYYFVPFSRFCELKAFSDIVCDSLCMFSGIMVTLIALDRYIHMRFLNRYSVWMTKRRAIMLIIFNGCTCSLMGAIQILAYLGEWYHLVLLIQNCIAILMIVGTSMGYFNAYRSLNMRTKQLDFGRSLPNTSSGARGKRNPTKEFLKAMIAILTTFMISFTPFVVSSALKFAYRNQNISDSKIIFSYIARLFVCMNSSLNAVLYLSLNRELKIYARQVVSFGYFEDTISATPSKEKKLVRLAHTHNSGFV